MELMSIAAAAARADVSTRTIKNWIDAGLLIRYEVGPKPLIKVDRTELSRLVRRVPTADDAA